MKISIRITAAVGKIVRDAARLARYGGLRDLEELPPHPITSLYYYTITQVLVDHPPELVVDVSGVAGRLGSRHSLPQKPDENQKLCGSGDVPRANATARRSESNTPSGCG